MRPEDKVTSLELSIALKEAGAKQESGFHHVRPNKTHFGYDAMMLMRGIPFAPWYDTIASAFDCPELLERLPKSSSVRKTALPDNEDETYSGVNDIFMKAFPDKNPAEALGLLYKWCLEDGRCNE